MFMCKKKIVTFIITMFAFTTIFAAEVQETAANTNDENANQANQQKKLFNLRANTGGITYTDPQKPIMVKKAAPRFNVILQSNPTTGYSWSLKDYDYNLIKPISRKYYPAKTGLIGSGGYEKWVFAIKNPPGFVVPHTTSITLIYSRPWDLQGAQAMNFKVVTVNAN